MRHNVVHLWTISIVELIQYIFVSSLETTWFNKKRQDFDAISRVDDDFFFLHNNYFRSVFHSWASFAEKLFLSPYFSFNRSHSESKKICTETFIITLILQESTLSTNRCYTKWCVHFGWPRWWEPENSFTANYRRKLLSFKVKPCLIKLITSYVFCCWTQRHDNSD